MTEYLDGGAMGSPARAGIGPVATATKPPHSRFPRASGDRPLDKPRLAI